MEGVEATSSDEGSGQWYSPPVGIGSGEGAMLPLHFF